MKHSDDLTKLAPALARFQAGIPHIGKGRTVEVESKRGRSYTFAYAPLDQIVSEVRPLLAAEGLSVSQYPSKDGLVTMILHESGQFLMDTMPLVLKGSMQEQGSAITYARRYSYCALLGIVADEDNDGNTAAGNTYNYRNQQGSTSNANGRKGGKQKQAKGSAAKRASKPAANTNQGQPSPDQQAGKSLVQRLQRMQLTNKAHNRAFFQSILHHSKDPQTFTAAECEKLESALQFIEDMYQGNLDHVRWLLARIAENPEPFENHEALRTFSKEMIAQANAQAA